jgi:hypothetical protein
MKMILFSLEPVCVIHTSPLFSWDVPEHVQLGKLCPQGTGLQKKSFTIQALTSHHKWDVVIVKSARFHISC